MAIRVALAHDHLARPSAHMVQLVPAEYTPRVFDILDTWNLRSIGGCTSDAGRPGDRHDESFPVNANEAEFRRIARFGNIGPTPGHFQVLTEDPMLNSVICLLSGRRVKLTAR